MLSAKTLIGNGGEMAVCGANESVEKSCEQPAFAPRTLPIGGHRMSRSAAVTSLHPEPVESEGSGGAPRSVKAGFATF